MSLSCGNQVLRPLCTRRSCVVSASNERVSCLPLTDGASLLHSHLNSEEGMWLISVSRCNVPPTTNLRGNCPSWLKSNGRIGCGPCPA